MKKFERYLEDLKGGILQDYKKGLRDEMSASLVELEREKEELTQAVKIKHHAIEAQQEVMKKSTATYEKRQKNDKIMAIVLKNLWNSAVDAFFADHAGGWYEYALKYVPHEKGIIRYNPSLFEDKYVQMIRSKRNDLELVRDEKLGDGFIFESESVSVDCTKAAFSEEHFAKMKHDLYRKLKTEKGRMKQLGVFYHLNTRIPHFSLFEKLREGDSFAEVRSQLEEHGFHSLQSDRDISPFLYVADIENQFLAEFQELVEGDRFLEALLWLKRHMPELRLKLRNALLKNAGLSERVSEVEGVCGNNDSILLKFTDFVSDPHAWGSYSLFTLEKAIDELYLEIIRNAVKKGESTYKEYVGMIDEQIRQDTDPRKQYESSAQKQFETQLGSSAVFQKLANEECSFVNRAITEYNTDLIALQTLVIHSYMFYDARIVASVPSNERGEMLVNYSIHA